MDRVRRRSRRYVIGACVAGLLAAGAPAAARADDGIARPPGAIDGRGYELVSQADKNDNQVADGIVPAAGFDRVLYSVHGGVPGAASGNQPQLIATRTAGGWQSHSILPPRGQLFATHYLDVASAPDLGRIVAGVYEGIGGPTYATDERLVLLDGDGGQTLLHAFPTFEGITAVSPLASDDLQHIYASISEQIDPTHVAATLNVYDFGTAPPALVSTMPGTTRAPACGLPGIGAEPGFAPRGVVQHQVSTDGMRIYFATRGDVCSGPDNLYLHDRGTGGTTLVSGPVVGIGTDAGIALFLGATPDGGEAFYETATTLDAADSTDGDDADMDVYRYDAATRANACVTCVVAHAAVASKNVAPGAVVSEDGSYLYFLSRQALRAGAVGGALNAYVVHAGTLGLVGVLDDSDPILSSVPAADEASELSHDGRFLVLMSNRSEMNAISGSDNGGRRQAYRYDAAGQTVTCVSCPSGGAAASDVSRPLVIASRAIRPDARSITEDGSMIFFVTPAALVSADVDGGADIYEWHDGTVRLITDGVTVRTAEAAPKVLTVSPDGRDLLFVDTARLTWDAQDDAFKIYDARIGGGFPPPPPPPAPCSGDACRGRPTPPPALGDVASSRTSGGGDVDPVPGTFVVARVGARARARLARTGRLTLSVRIRRPGRVSLIGQARVGKRIVRVAHASRHTRRAGAIALPVRLSRAARRRLAVRGRLTVVLGVRFSQSPRAKRVVLHLTAPGDGR